MLFVGECCHYNCLLCTNVVELSVEIVLNGYWDGCLTSLCEGKGHLSVDTVDILFIQDPREDDWGHLNQIWLGKYWIPTKRLSRVLVQRNKSYFHIIISENLTGCPWKEEINKRERKTREVSENKGRHDLTKW